MPGPTSITQIDLAALPGKTYFDIDREWREEFIYFLMVDRFQDDLPRTPILQAHRSRGIHTPDNAFYGGTIKGITRNLDYIAGLVQYFRDSYSNYMRIWMDGNRQGSIGTVGAARTGAQGEESDLGSRRLPTG